MTSHDQPTARLTDVIGHHPGALSLQVTYTEATHAWSVIVLDHEHQVLETVEVITTPNAQNALAVIDTHLISAGRPRTSDWVQADQPEGTTFTADLRP